MKLNQIAEKPGARRRPMRVGRGIGSGKGKNGGTGHKGQKSRSGVAINGFEGGQMPIYRRLPKRGFRNPFRKAFDEVNLDSLQAAIDAGRLDAGGAIDAAALRAAGLASGARDGVALLGRGDLSAKVTLKVARATAGARAAVEKAGGTVETTLPTRGTDEAGA